MYDMTEAQEMLTRFADELNPDHRARVEAARELLETLCTLTDREGFDWRTQSDGGVLVTAPGGGAKVKVVNDHGRVLLYQMGGKSEEVRLEYDPVSKGLRSYSDDPRPRAATEPPRRRSAVAEVVSTVIAALRQALGRS